MAQESEAIMNVMHEGRIFTPPQTMKDAYINSFQQYKKLYNESIRNPEKFWEKQAKIISWYEPWREVLQWNPPNAKWFVEGKLNACFNCVDRHITTSKKIKLPLSGNLKMGRQEH